MRKQVGRSSRNKNQMSVQLRSLCLSMAFECCSSKQQLDAQVGRQVSLKISLEIMTAGSLLHSSWCAGTRNRAQAEKLS